MSVLLVCLALAGFALVYTLWVPREEVHVPQPPTPLDHLREKRKVLYDNLKDLHFEYRTGKLSDEDYQQLKSSLQYELAAVMKNIEELESRARGKAVQAAAAPEPSAAAPAAKPEAGVCPACGHANPANHKHCSQCGARLFAALVALLAAFALTALPAAAQRMAVQGVVENGTTGKPAAGVALTLVRASESKETLAQTSTDAQGRFRFDAVETPAPPAVLLVQAEHAGVRYTEPVMGSAPLTLKIYNSGAVASSIRVPERAVILHPSRGKLLVNEIYFLRNESDPPAAYTRPGGTFRFFVPEGGSRSVEASAQGAGGISLPLEAKPQPSSAGVLAVSHPLKPGESRIEVRYHLDYPGSLVFEAQAVEKIERTRVAVPEGVTAEGEGMRFLGSEPQTRFRIYEVAGSERWSLKLAGEGRAVAGGESDSGGEARSDSGIIEMPSPIGQRLYLLLPAVLVALGAGFARLWRQERPAAVSGKVAAKETAAGKVARRKRHA